MMNFKRTTSVLVAGLVLTGSIAACALNASAAQSETTEARAAAQQETAEEPALISTNEAQTEAESETGCPAGTYLVEVNGIKTDVRAVLMVPLRSTAEALGFTVTWNGDGTITLDDGATHADLTIGEDLYQVVTSVEGALGASAPFSLGAAPYVSEDSTYVPLGLFDALLGSQEGAITIRDGKLSILTEGTEDETESAQIPSPFTDCESLDAAAELTGFSLTVPETPEAVQVMDTSMIQAFYGISEDGEEMLIRKAAGEGDISGDYNDYAVTKTVEVEGVQVTLKGEDEEFSLAIWETGGYTYSVSLNTPAAETELTQLVSGIR